MPDTAEAAWLRREREKRGWSKMGMVRRLVKAARDGGDTAMSVDSMRRNVYRWEAEGGVSERNRILYCQVLGIELSQFGRPADAPAVVDPPSPASPVMTYGGTPEPGMGEFAVGQEVAMAGHESSGHASEREPYDISETTFEQLRADVVRLSRQTDIGAPLPTFRGLRQVRDRIHMLLDRRLFLRETADLYFLLGCVNALLGVNANRLGYPGTAEELLRAGWTYASIIEHNPLRAMLRAQLSYVMYYRGRYSESRDLAADGLRYVSQGSPGADLHGWHAHAAAQLGDLDTARQSVALADAAQDVNYRDDLLEIGGQFVVTRATHKALAGGALANISGAEHDAAAELEQAISLYDEGPGDREEFWFAGKPLASVYLAVVRLRSGALDAAVEALEPALALPAEQRISDITGRLADIRRELAAPIFQGSPQARDLGDQIEAFGRDTISADLHSLTG
jgi:tetratricopeptide (TPR) repeat protein